MSRLGLTLTLGCCLVVPAAPSIGRASQPPDEPEVVPAEALPPPRVAPDAATPPRASSSNRDLGGPMDGGGAPGYAAAWYPSRSVGGQPTDLEFVRQSLNVGVPVLRNDRDMLLARLGVRNTLFDTGARLPDSGRPFPEQLWDLNVGLNYMRRFENGWSGMLMMGIGSASDVPFHSIREITGTLGAMVKIPAANDRDSWQVGAMYLVGGPVNFPLPILSYSWNPTDRLKVNIGLPLSIVWRPTDEWTLNVSYVPLYNINARFTRRIAPQLQLFGAYEYLNESYLLAERADIRDRFFVFEQRLVAGVRWDVGSNGTIEVNGGHSFGRVYGEGQSQWSSLKDRIEVEPGPFLGAQFRLRF